ncbi:hypothetical protein KY285_005933 [Solanum tuberosum]|nr:hypothetical protein KY289_006423 [Solanum tuberosum]KAH0752785.1 hypothetical protein KY285_005933 [Solanum tuberosum]
MKLSGEKLVPNQPGTITIIPEKPNDLWLLFNLIANDDVVSATTTRKIQFSSHSTKNRKIQFSSDSTKKKSSSRVQVQLEIKITNVDYAKDCSTIRVRGKTITSNEYVNPGTFHTLELETKKEFKLTKKLWDEETIRILKEGSNQNGNVEYAHELLAIETLLITEELLENKDINLRKKYSKLKKLVQETGGKVVQFSDIERDRLAQMTEIAAILRFPIPNIDDLVL